MWLLVVPRKLVRLAAVQIYFKGGRHRDYLVYYKPPHSGFGGRTEGEWSVRSFVDGSLDGTLDLRDRDHASRLEKVLTSLPL
jgi:hypothetical protein